MKRDAPAFEIARAYILTQLYGDGIAPRFGVATYELHLLHRLAGEPPMTQSELGRRLLRDPMSVSRLVRALERRRLLRRRPSEDDARAYLVELTPKGQGLVDEVMRALDDDDPFRDWSEGELRAFTQMLRRACDSLHDACVRAGIDPRRVDTPARRAAGRRGTDEVDARTKKRPTPTRRRVGRSSSEEPVPRPSKRRRR